MSLSNVEFFIKKTDRGWLRDSGPMFVKDGNEMLHLILNSMPGQNMMITNLMIKFLLLFQKN